MLTYTRIHVRLLHVSLAPRSLGPLVPRPLLPLLPLLPLHRLGCTHTPAQGKVIRHPRRKCVVMLCGNHSAGKSSFVNWYVGEDIQGTGVAVETQAGPPSQQPCARHT